MREIVNGFISPGTEKPKTPSNSSATVLLMGPDGREM